MQIPTIHLNGTSRDELCRQLLTAHDAVMTAATVLAGAAPHGRDFYPQGDEALRRALAEHRARLGRLESVAEELAEIVAAVRRQKGRGR